MNSVDVAIALKHYVDQHEDVTHFCVAYSGGVDSHVMLALMARLRDEKNTFELRAVHINHGLQERSGEWAEHARQTCQALDVPIDVRECNVVQDSSGPEAAARRARYRQFAKLLQTGEHLLLAQHAEDQAETFLLQALRGSGPDGLAGIPKKRAFANGMMARPFLECSQASVMAMAKELELDWVEDPTNQESRFDRNYLRLKIMPLITSRWPAATQTLGRSAMRCAASSQALMSMAQQDLDSVKVAGKPELRLSALQKLPRERAFTAIRLWVRQRELRMPRLQDLVQVHTTIINARHDSNGVVNVRDYEFRRHRDSLYLLLPHQKPKPFRYTWQPPFNDLFIRETGSTITRAECFRQGLRLPDENPVVVKSRAGGELIKLGTPAFHKSVKSILQESSVPTWQRSSIPLIYIGEQLAAVWQLSVAVEHRSKTSVGNLLGKISTSSGEMREEDDSMADAQS